MENDVPKFLRLKDLQERGIAMTHQAVRHMQLHECFPLGLLGPGTRVWTVAEINEWLDSRPVAVSEQARRRSEASARARKANCEARRQQSTGFEAVGETSAKTCLSPYRVGYRASDNKEWPDSRRETNEAAS